MSYYKAIQNIDFADGGYILLPQDESKKYPVVYMFHGTGGVEEWKDTAKGNIAAMMEDVVGNGGTQSVVVMPKIRGCGYASVDEDTDIEKIINDEDWGQFFNYDIYGLIKYISSTYEQYVMRGKKNTAIAGFSMGATASIYYAVKNRDIFCSFGAVSVSQITKKKIKPEDFVLDKEKGAIYFIGYGTAEGNDFVASDQYCIDSFSANNVSVNVKTNKGTGHNFLTFNPLLADYLSMIFKG